MRNTILSAVITIITGVAIYWLTTGWKRTPPPKPPASLLDGRVYDEASRRLLEGVAVAVQLDGSNMQQTQTTDSEGRYLIRVPPTKRQTAKIWATAVGYDGWQRYLSAN